MYLHMETGDHHDHHHDDHGKQGIYIYIIL
jgi:hypothetical protein